MTESAAKASFDLAKREDREKLAGLVRAEFGMNIAADDALFVFLRLYQYTAHDKIESLLAQILEEKDSFGDLFDQQGKELARQFAVVINAIGQHGNQVFQEKETQLRGISSELIAEVDKVVTNRLDNISTQLVARIEVEKASTKYSRLTWGLFAAFGCISTSILTAVLMAVLLRHA